MNDFTRMLSDLREGRATAEDLLPLVYEELRALAARRLAQEKPGQTLQATALVHEAYMRLVASEQAQPGWNSRNHFFAAAAEAMRRILIEAARQKRRIKRGGGHKALPLDGVDLPIESDLAPEDILALDEALTRLSEEDPIKAELVKLRYFAGLSVEDAAEVLAISRSTATRYWDYARSWLFSELSGYRSTPDGRGESRSS